MAKRETSADLTEEFKSTLAMTKYSAKIDKKIQHSNPSFSKEH